MNRPSQPAFSPFYLTVDQLQVVRRSLDDYIDYGMIADETRSDNAHWTPAQIKAEETAARALVRAIEDHIRSSGQGVLMRPEVHDE